MENGKWKMENYSLFPAKHNITDPTKQKNAFLQIAQDLKKQIGRLKSQGKLLETHRLKQKVIYDLNMIKELGYVKGIENYSRYFDGRLPGEAPYTLLDYYKKPYGENWLTFIDESHITFPQIRGMFAGDLSRKNTLIEYGFRLPSALDNRPLKFDEFMRRIPNFIATSATPADWEMSMAESETKELKNKRTKELKNISKGVVEQLLRPTGIPDPEINIRSVQNQVEDVVREIKYKAKVKQRTLVTTLTKKTAEDLSEYLKEQGINVSYLHSDIKTLERTDILDNLRKGNFDCIVGVNLLREGLDLPEVSLVAILDADKEGFLRSEVSLIQTMGRAARHVEGKVILYADRVTGSMQRAIIEVERRRQYQLKMNKKYGITPRSIEKPLREKLVEFSDEPEIEKILDKKYESAKLLPDIDIERLTPMDRKKLALKLRREMRIAAQDLNFELAIEIRDKIKEIEKM